MTVHTLQTAFPNLPLKAGMRLRLEAINPTTGADVASVTSTRWSIYGYDKSPGSPLAEELPTWVPEDAGQSV